MNFIADEGVDREIVEALRAHGHAVLHVAEMSPGINDVDVLNLANKASSILITSTKISENSYSDSNEFITESF